MADVEEQVKRIQQHPGVQGVIVVNDEGMPIKSTLDNSTTVQCSNLLTKLGKQARQMVREIDPTNDLSFLRIRTKKNEMMVAPNDDHTLICLQANHTGHS